VAVEIGKLHLIDRHSNACRNHAAIDPSAAAIVASVVEPFMHRSVVTQDEIIDALVAIKVGKPYLAARRSRAGRDNATIHPSARAVAALVDPHMHGAIVGQDDVIRMSVTVEIGEPHLTARRADACRDNAAIHPSAGAGSIAAL